jgi:hypothetical protein
MWRSTRPFAAATATLPLRAWRLVDQVPDRLRYLHYSLRIEQACVH